MERLHPGSILAITTIVTPKDVEDVIPEAASWPRPSFLKLEGTAAADITKDRYTTLGKVFDALLWLGPTGTISYSKLLPETVAEESYYREALRRDALWIEQFQEELRALRQQGTN